MSEIINIALAEDEHLVRRGFTSIINEVENLNVIIAAANGKELVEMVDESDVVPDIVLMDLNMPEMNGVETTKLLQKTNPSIKIIALTSYDSGAFILSMIRIGAAAYVLKNEDPETLIETIQAVVEKGFHYDERVLEVLRDNAVHPIKQTKSVRFEDVHFSRREREVLQLICEQLTTVEISEKLFISPRTVEGHRNNLLLKTGVKNSVGLVIYAIQSGLVEIGPSSNR